MATRVIARDGRAVDPSAGRCFIVRPFPLMGTTRTPARNQRAEHRDTQAIHDKLDQILHALGDARNELTRVDEEEPEEIEKRRSRMRKNDSAPLCDYDWEPKTSLNVEEHHLPECARPRSEGGVLLE